MRKILQLFSPAAFLVIAALVMSSSPVAAKSLTVDVAPNLDTFDAMREAAEGAMMPTGPFYIQGQIFHAGTLNTDGSIPEGATAIGIFYCWGWTYDGVVGKGVVSQIFAIDGRGEVHVQAWRHSISIGPSPAVPLSSWVLAAQRMSNTIICRTASPSA